MKKQTITESKIKEIISEEIKRMQKKMMLESEKKKLIKKLHEMYEEEAGCEVEEGFVGDLLGTSAESKSAKLKKDLETKMAAWSRSGVSLPQGGIDQLMKDAEADGFNGVWKINQDKIVYYTPSANVKWSSQFAGGGTAGQGRAGSGMY